MDSATTECTPEEGLRIHEAHSKERAEHIEEALQKLKGVTMSHDDEKHVHVHNIFKGHKGGGMDGNNGLLAAALLGNQHTRGDYGAGLGGGLGAGLLGGVLGGLIFNRRGGFGEGEADCAPGGIGASQAAFDSTILNGITGLTAAVPTTALQTQNAIQSAIGSLALGTQQGLSNVKDAVQNSATANLIATNNVGTQVQTGTLQNIIAIGNDGDKTRALIQSISDMNLQRELGVAQALLAEERTSRRVRDVEVNVNQTVNQNQAQAQAQQQQQQQFASLFSLLHGVNNELQVARATNANLIVGNTGAVATGPQTANPVNVRA